MDAPAIAYLIGLSFSEALRLPRRLHRIRSPGEWTPAGPSSRFAERLVLGAVVLGMWILPFLHAFTRLLRRYDYAVPAWAVWIGAGIFLISLAIRWKAQNDLGAGWSHTLETAEGHRLVTEGIYAWTRHPLYASLILWATAQPLLVHNLVAGWCGALAVALIWLIRVPREEQLMADTFGAEYRQYMERTGKLLPRCHPGRSDVSERSAPGKGQAPGT